MQELVAERGAWQKVTNNQTSSALIIICATTPGTYSMHAWCCAGCKLDLDWKGGSQQSKDDLCRWKL